MEKRTLSIINLILSIFIFLCIYGNTCYLGALKDNDFSLQLKLCFYYAGFVILSIICICSYPYYSKKIFLISSLYCILYNIIIFFVWLVSLFPNDLYLDSNSLTWIVYITFIFPPIISSLYFYIWIKKEE